MRRGSRKKKKKRGNPKALEFFVGGTTTRSVKSASTGERRTGETNWGNGGASPWGVGRRPETYPPPKGIEDKWGGLGAGKTRAGGHHHVASRVGRSLKERGKRGNASRDRRDSPAPGRQSRWTTITSSENGKGHPVRQKIRADPLPNPTEAHKSAGEKSG